MWFGCLVSVAVCLMMLVLSLPAKCWAVVRLNCRRLDGSWSWRRLRREGLAFWEYGTTLAVPVLLLFMTVFVLTTLLFSYVISLDLMARSFAAFDVDSEVWRSNLRDVRQDHTQFLSDRGFDSKSALGIQQSLWHGWPAFVCVVLILTVAALFGFVKGAGRSAARHVVGIRRRRRMYARFDVSQMQVAARDAVPGQLRSVEGPSAPPSAC